MAGLYGWRYLAYGRRHADGADSLERHFERSRDVKVGSFDSYRLRKALIRILAERALRLLVMPVNASI